MNNKKSLERKRWEGMIQRCHNPRHPSFRRYGAAGIIVAPEWRESYEAFFLHIGPIPTPRHSIDRIDNTRGYEPGNVRWATATQQQRNKGNNRRLLAGGESLALAEIAERAGITYPAARKRAILGWSGDRIMGTPVKTARMRRLLSDGQVQEAMRLRLGGMKFMDLGRRFGCDYSVVQKALYRAGYRPIPRRKRTEKP